MPKPKRKRPSKTVITCRYETRHIQALEEKAAAQGHESRSSVLRQLVGLIGALPNRPIDLDAR